MSANPLAVQARATGMEQRKPQDAHVVALICTAAAYAICLALVQTFVCDSVLPG